MTEIQRCKPQQVDDFDLYKELVSQLRLMAVKRRFQLEDHDVDDMALDEKGYIPKELGA